MTKPPPMLAADHIRELVRAQTTRHKVDRFVPVPNVGELPKWDRIKKTATITHPSLIEQLEEAVQQSKDTSAYGGGSAKSKPSARLDAIEALSFIERDSRKRANELGIEPAPLIPRLYAISGKIGSETDPQVKSWWVKARVSTGWEQAPYEPDVPCPNTECERRGTLRIRLDQYIATCTACGATWDDENYNTLGEYVRWAFEHLSGARHWLYDAEGYPVECTECLIERQVMAERKVARKKAADTPA